MSIRCSICKREYDVTLFEFARVIVCECGNRLGLKNEEILNQSEEIRKQYDLKFEEEKLSEIKRAQDRIVFLILNTDYKASGYRNRKGKI